MKTFSSGLLVMFFAAFTLIFPSQNSTVSTKSQTTQPSTNTIAQTQTNKQNTTTYQIYNNVTVQQYVNSIGQHLVKYSGRPDIPFRFIVLNDNEINAFATPDAHIFITTGMMKYLNSESELAAVLAHEIGHITARHYIKRTAVNYGLNLSLGALSNYYGFDPNTLLPQLTQAVITQKFSQSEEIQADKIGTLMMTRAGYSPTGMLNLQQRLSQIENRNILSQFLSSHPSGQARVNTIQQYIRKNKINSQNLVTDNDIFHQVQALIQ